MYTDARCTDKCELFSESYSLQIDNREIAAFATKSKREIIKNCSECFRYLKILKWSRINHLLCLN